jgi:hypothetical protein
MKFSKVLTTGLSVVGAVVVVDRLADMVSTQHKKQISKCLSNLDRNHTEQLSDLDEDCYCSDTMSTEKPAQREYSPDKIFPDVKKYVSPYALNEDDNVSFQYSIKVKPNDESMYNELFSGTSTMEHGEKSSNNSYNNVESSDESINEDIIGSSSFGNI